VRALSLKQPAASLIADARKTIETRTWSTSYRGPLLICASSTVKDRGPIGVALCVADVVDCRPMTLSDEGAACCRLYPCAWAWVLADVRKVQPFPVKGRLRLFAVEDRLVKVIA
jgi:hypothetical protein